jgi:hypothetical protein
MIEAKIRLSPKEWALVRNTEWFLTKSDIIEKVFVLFSYLSDEVRLQTHSAVHFPVKVMGQSPKISKGENYRGLPYVMLDYPRYFGKENIFAVRTMFWWGNFFSTTLHLKGEYQKKYVDCLRTQFLLLCQNNFHISIAEDEWRHDFGEDNYIPLNTIDATSYEKILTNEGFLKISAKISINQWDEAAELLLNYYRTIFKALQD